ncbi:MAG: phenylacetate--CoA ligase, partial [Clostridia bacterium]
HIAEDHFYPEIINSQSLDVLPEGEIGELVITTLTKEAFPILRYRTKDITKLDYSTCDCGRTMARMSKTMGRSDDMFKIKGVNVFPTQIESVLLTISGIGPHYQLILRRKNFTDSLEVLVELIDSTLLEKFSELEKLEKKIKSSLHTVLGIECKVTLCQPRTIERTAGKAKRVIDLRNT